MKTRITVLLVAVLTLSGLGLTGQTNQFTDVLKIYLRDQGTIVENREIRGYYTFYNVEKADRKTNNYLLRVLDENLREVNSVTITRPNTYTLLESAYNGSAFAFVFLDYKNKLMEILSFDKTCKQIGTKKMTGLTNKELYAYNAQAQGEENTTQTIFGVRGKGFMRVTPEKKEKMGYDIELLNDQLKSQWKTGSPATTKKWLGAMTLDINENHALIEVNERDKALSKDITFRLLCIDLATGKQVFDVPLADPKYTLSNSSATLDATNNQIVMLGEYYALSDKSISGKSLGFYAGYMDMKGAMKEKKFISWDKDVSKMIPVNEKGRFDNKAYVFFHRVVRLTDGKIVAIGEQFKKAASGAGIAMQVLSGGKSGASVVKMVTLNMMLFEFDAEFNLTGVKVFEKDPSNVMLPSGIGIYPPAMLARYINYLGYFDYVYTQVSPDNSSFTVTYVNYDREKGEKPKNVAGTIIYADNKYSEDNIPLSKAKTSYAVYPAKPGYIMISEYSRKEKTLDVRLEKFNY